MKWTLIIALVTCSLTAFSQEEEEEIKEGGFKKENIFTGGSVSLSFGNRTFLGGANPVLGYKIAEWVDAGIVFNYQYSSFRHLNNDKERLNIYGGGVFARVFPVSFLFGHVQFEHNFMALKYLPSDGSSAFKENFSANSLLVGPGLAQGRRFGMNEAFFYFSLLWDIADNDLSPYSDINGNGRVIYRAGVNVYLFGGRNR